MKITPSEIELLRVSASGDKVLFGNLTRKLDQNNVAALGLLNQILPVAFMANETAGVFRLRIDPIKPIFKMGQRARVLVSTNGAEVTWPEPSLEAKLARLVDGLCSEAGEVTIPAVMTHWVVDSALTHVQNVIIWVYDALTLRGFLRREIEERLRLFHLTCYEIPSTTRDLMQEYARINRVSRSETTPHAAPKVHSILKREIGRALRCMDLD